MTYAAALHSMVLLFYSSTDAVTGWIVAKPSQSIADAHTPVSPLKLRLSTVQLAFVVPSVLTLIIPEIFSSFALPLMEASVFDSKSVTATDPLTPAIPPAAARVMVSTVPY